MNYFPFHVGDYASHTGHLEPMEDLAYRRMLDAYYLREGALPVDAAEVARLVRMRDYVKEVQSMLREFFVLTDDGWRHERCEREIESMRDKQQKQRDKANKRWNKPEPELGNAAAMPRHNHGNADAMPPTPTPTPTPTPKEKISMLTHATARPMAEPDENAPNPAKSSIPECPHLEILQLWSEVLPTLPQHLPNQWRGSRADHLRARWREKAVEKKWQTKDEGLTYFRRLFAHVGKSKFLTGQIPTRDPTKRPFVIELEWLVSPGNWAKVLEGKYNEEANE